MRWLVPGAVLLSGWLAMGVAPALAGREALSGILAGNPAAGSALFASRGCIRCHAVLGDGGVAGPDLGRLAARGPLIELAGIMWNHSVRMDAGAGRGTLEAEQMAHLVAFLYSLNSLERPGDPAAGARLFATKGCRSCHALGGAGGDVGPRLDKYSRYASPLFLTAALWEHGPAMAKSMRERGVRRPTFAGADIADLMAFIRASGSSPGRVYARPGNPARGEELFAGKRCAECHAVRGEGGRVGPDLGERGRLGGGLVQIAGTMWNHGPAMWADGGAHIEACAQRGACRTSSPYGCISSTRGDWRVAGGVPGRAAPAAMPSGRAAGRALRLWRGTTRSRRRWASSPPCGTTGRRRRERCSGALTWPTSSPRPGPAGTGPGSGAENDRDRMQRTTSRRCAMKRYAYVWLVAVLVVVAGVAGVAAEEIEVVAKKVTDADHRRQGGQGSLGRATRSLRRTAQATVITIKHPAPTGRLPCSSGGQTMSLDRCMSSPARRKKIKGGEIDSRRWDINTMKGLWPAVAARKQGKEVSLRTNAPGERLDVWHWKAQRTNPAGYVDDQWLGNEVKKNGDATARGNDAKTAGGYADNWDKDAKRPKFAFKDGVKPGPILLRKDAVEIKDHGAFKAGDRLPARCWSGHRQPRRHRGQACGMARRWTLEIRRARDTGQEPRHPVRRDRPPCSSASRSTTVPGMSTHTGRTALSCLVNGRESIGTEGGVRPPSRGACDAGTWRRWTAGALLVVALGPAPAWAGRPLDTEDTGTVEPGKAEIELSGDFARNPEDRTWLAKGVLSLGVLPRLEARIESMLHFLEPDEERARGGVGDSLVGLKYRFLDEADALPALLGSLTVRLPTGDADRGLGASEVDVGLLAVASKTLGPVTVTWNGGYTFVTRDRDLEFWTLAAAVEYRATAAWSLLGEVVSALPSHRGPNTAVLRVGTTYTVHPRVRLDAGVGFGATRDSPDVLVTFGATFVLF
jgi:mono/diheme cytochrome c family protein